MMAADTGQIINEADLDQLFAGMDAEGLHLIAAFESHQVNLEPSVTAAAGTLIHSDDNLTSTAQDTIRSNIHGILWHSLTPVHNILFSGRELDSFSLAGTLQRALDTHNEDAYTALGDRLIDTCTPVRMCEDSFEAEAVTDDTLKSWINDKLESGLPQHLAEDPAYLAHCRTLVIQVLEASCSTLVTAIKDSVAIPL